jgi:hypothetical protein
MPGGRVPAPRVSRPGAGRPRAPYAGPVRAMTGNVWWRSGGAGREREAAVPGVVASWRPPYATRTVPLPPTDHDAVLAEPTW